jgi:hypothetical protein
MRNTKSGRWRIYSAKEGDKVVLEPAMGGLAWFERFERDHAIAVDGQGRAVVIGWGSAVFRDIKGSMVKCLPSTVSFFLVVTEDTDPDGKTRFVLEDEPRFAIERDDEAEMASLLKELEGIS